MAHHDQRKKPNEKILLYHQTAQQSLPRVLREGLRYGSEGRGSRKSYARITNWFLDARCPDFLARQGVSRQKCLYAYLCMNDVVIDVKTGEPIAPGHWQPDASQVAVCVWINPREAFVGDLAVYDRLAEGLQTGEDAAHCEKLGAQYWQRVVPLPGILQWYEASAQGIKKLPDAPPALPSAFKRPEVLLTSDVPPSCLAADS